jgi:hypothetical protein
MSEDDPGAGSARQRAASMYSRRFSTSAEPRTVPGVVGPLHEHEREDHLVHPAPEHGEQHQRDQDGGEGELEVDDPHHDRLDPPPA